MELHLQVKEARKQAGLTQEQLATAAQVRRRDISRFENGENVTMRTFYKIISSLPNLKELTLGHVRLRKEEDAPAATRVDELRERAAAVLLQQSGQAPLGAAPTTAEPPSSRELNLLQTIGQLLVEIASGERRS
jgi:transcriptional regulator with XRE-family HTH domain